MKTRWNNTIKVVALVVAVGGAIGSVRGQTQLPPPVMQLPSPDRGVAGGLAPVEGQPALGAPTPVTGQAPRGARGGAGGRGAGGRGGRGGVSVPSVSVRPADIRKFRVAAQRLLGWRTGVRTDSFGSLTFSESAAKADAAGFAYVEGVSTQKVSAEIARNLDYNLGPEEVDKVKFRLSELRLQMPAYRMETLPKDAAARRKVFEFAKGLGVDLVVCSPESAMFAELDKLADEFGINVALVARDPKTALQSMSGLSKRIGVMADTGAWMEGGLKPTEALKSVGDKLIAVNLRDRSGLGAKARDVTLGTGAAGIKSFLVDMSRIQPPRAITPWPPRCGDCTGFNGELKPVFVEVAATGPGDSVANLAQSLESYEKLIRYAAGDRVEQLSKITPISGLDLVPVEARPRIEAAVPREALVKPKKARKLLITDLNVGGVFYHGGISYINYAVDLMARNTGAFTPVFSNDVDKLKYPQIKEFDAVVLNNIQGDPFIDPDLISGFLRYVREGGGVVTMHATSFASQNLPEFGELVGAAGGVHQGNGELGVLKIDDPDSPLTRHLLGKGFEFFDEYYHFPPEGPYTREKAHILISLDAEKSDLRHWPVRPDQDYGMIWIKSYGKGRLFQCAMAHRPELIETPGLSKLVLGGIQFALGDLAADTTPSARLTSRKRPGQNRVGTGYAI